MSVFKPEAEVHILVWGSVGSVTTSHLFIFFFSFKINGGWFGSETFSVAYLCSTLVFCSVVETSDDSAVSVAEILNKTMTLLKCFPFSFFDFKYIITLSVDSNLWCSLLVMVRGCHLSLWFLLWA